MIERLCGVSAKSAETMIEVVEAKRHHCGMMARRMRKVHRDILASGGVSAHRELIWVFGQSSFRRSVFFEGEIVAIGGITGSRLSTQGVAWLVLAEEFRNHPLRSFGMPSGC